MTMRYDVVSVTIPNVLVSVKAEARFVTFSTLFGLGTVVISGGSQVISRPIRARRATSTIPFELDRVVIVK